MLNLSRLTVLAAGLGGLAWTVKALTITALDAYFGVPESVLFISGLVLMLVASVLVARDVVTRRGAGGLLAKAAVALGLVVATSLCIELGGALVAGVASGDNLGLEEEGGILLAGLLWLALAAVAAAPRREVRRAVVA